MACLKNHSMKTNQENEVASFRIDTVLKNELQKECGKKSINFSTLVNQILVRHVRWDNMAEKMDMITMPKTVYKAYTSKISDEDIKEVARTAEREGLKNYTLLNTGEFTIKSFLETLDLWLTINHISYEHAITNNDGHQFVVRHNLGIKFSTLLNHIVNDLVEELDRKYTNMNSTDENLTFVIEKGA